MNAFLWCALALIAALMPLLVVAARRSLLEGLVALEVAGTTATLTLLLLAEGVRNQALTDLALVLGALSFAGAIAFVRFLIRAR